METLQQDVTNRSIPKRLQGVAKKEQRKPPPPPPPPPAPRPQYSIHDGPPPPSSISRPNPNSDELLVSRQQSQELDPSNLNVSDGPVSTEKDVYWKYIPLYQAALRGDWSIAETFFNRNEGSLTAKINEYSETALHIAAGAGRQSKSIDFVKNLVDKILREVPGQQVPDTISEEAPENLVPDRISEEALKILEIGDQESCTPLHIAAWAGNTRVVEILLGKRRSLIYIRDKCGRSALDLAARNAKEDTLNKLLDVTKGDPLSMLFPIDARTKKNDPSPNVIKTPSESESIYDEDSAAAFLIRVITSGFYDVALDLVKRYPELASVKQNNGNCGLQALSRKVSAFKSGSHYKWWQRPIYDLLVKLDGCTASYLRVDIETGDSQKVTPHKCSWARLLVECFCTFVPCLKNIPDQKKMHHQALKLVKCLCKGVRTLDDSEAYNLRAKGALLTAAKLGIHEVIEEIVESFPNLLWAIDKKSDLNIFHIAVQERHANVFNLIYQMGDYQQLLVPRKDKAGNNLLHLAGGLGPNKNNQVSGAALQMQRELQWFEEVKKFANPRDIDWPNNNGITPPMLFTEEHKPLRAEGEKWMKMVANSCTIPAALIVTVVFAAAITVPGGINGTNGLPILSKEVVFNIFAVSNAISLFAAITSLLVSLSILTCRYAEGDFLFALPNRLIIGLVTLFLSITTMVIAFSAALYLMFGNKERAWILYPVAALACIPIISFASLQFPLLVDLMMATYGPRIFGKQSNRPFY